MVIDSNQISTGDDLERYDLHRDLVEIDVEGNLGGSVTVQPRSVFTVEAGRATVEAEARPNTWLTVAFFDLPDASQAQGVFSAPYPVHAPLHLYIDNQLVPELEGVVWIIGEGGKPTSMNAMPLLPVLEDELEPQTMVRLRARGEDAEGFDPAWSIVGITAEIQYDPDCVTSPRAHLGSNAAGGTVTVGPSSPALPASSGLEGVRILLTHPKGFTLPSAGLLDPTRLGAGPILDIVFDREDDPSCSGTLGQYIWVRALEVRERDGMQRVSRPFPSEIAPDGSTSFDASEFFHFHYVDPDPPS